MAKAKRLIDRQDYAGAKAELKAADKLVPMSDEVMNLLDQVDGMQAEQKKNKDLVKDLEADRAAKEKKAAAAARTRREVDAQVRRVERTRHLPRRWTVSDECYYSNELNPDIHVLLSADLTTVEDEERDTYPAETFGQQFPLCWCHHFEGGRQWYTALGHDPEFYEDALFVQHLRGGILWILGAD